MHVVATMLWNELFAALIDAVIIHFSKEDGWNV